MANREALRALQSRLAERMQAARTEERRDSWLAVQAAGAGFLLPLDQSGEIFNVSALTRLPHAKPWFCGVANLRGGLHGVVDLAEFLGLREHRVGAAPNDERDAARLVALNPGIGALCALRVDRLLGLRHEAQLSPDGQAADGPSFAAGLWRDAQGLPWQALDLAALAQHDDFLSIAAPLAA